MEFSFNILQIYRQYCHIMSGMHANGGEVYGPVGESQKARFSREALAELWKEVESKISTSTLILEEVYKLMSRLDLKADFSEFSRFYNFVFFICRENGQKNITVSRAVKAWRLVLAGRFRLLDQWCNFVETNHRHNISEDTWRQVLAFSRCVHENLEGYDPKGAWPVLIDDFVDHMYRIRGSDAAHNSFSDGDDSEPQKCDKTMCGLKKLPGSKRKMSENSSNMTDNSKRRHHHFVDKSVKRGPQSPCAVLGCVSKGYSGLFFDPSCLLLDQGRS